MKYCSKCILNNHTPFLSFDEKKECSYCKEQKIIENDPAYCLVQNKKDINIIIKKAKAKRKGKYDCVVAVSGGKDSIGALYIVKKIYKLNPLVITFSNEFVSDNMIKNVKSAVEKLSLDWRIYHFSNIKNIIKHFLKSPYRKQISVCDVCQLAISPLNLCREVAMQEGISLVFTGSTVSQKIGSMKKGKELYSHYNYSKRYKKVMTEVGNYLKKFNDTKGMFPLLSDDSLVITSPWHYLSKNEVDRGLILETLDWKPTKNSFPKASTNCSLAFLTSYLGRKYHIANYDITLSRSVRLGEMSREEARSKFFSPVSNKVVIEVLNKIGIRIEDL